MHIPIPILIPHRHADLLAADISAELCLTYIDRFLMFYVATAERLQRTSAWMEKLEGGEKLPGVFPLLPATFKPLTLRFARTGP